MTTKVMLILILSGLALIFYNLEIRTHPPSDRLVIPEQARAWVSECAKNTNDSTHICLLKWEDIHGKGEPLKWQKARGDD